MAWLELPCALTRSVNGIVSIPGQMRVRPHQMKLNLMIGKESKISVRSGKNGKFIRIYDCDVGADEEGEPANPSTTTVVFTRLLIEGDWVDTMTVGMSCMCQVGIQCREDYSDYHLEEAAALGESNILPFDEWDGEAMDTWRDHNGTIRAVAVVPDKYLFQLLYSTWTWFTRRNGIVGSDESYCAPPSSRLLGSFSKCLEAAKHTTY